MSDSVTARPLDLPTRAMSCGRRSWFFFGAATLMAALAFFSFSPTFYLRGHVSAARPLPFELPPYMVVHGIVMTSWCLFFVLQAWLPAFGRISWHRRIGWTGAALAAAAMATALYTTIHMVRLRTGAGLPAAAGLQFGMHEILVTNLLQLPALAGLVIAALVLRRRREWHARLMYWAFVVTIVPAFGGGGARMLSSLMEPWLPTGLPPALAAVALAAGALAIHDIVVRRKIHPASATGAAVEMAALIIGPLIADSAPGRAFFLGLA